MEILKLVGKREGVLEFGNRSNCHAAKFIKEYYAKYIEANQIEADLETNESPQLGDEIVKVINEHQSKFDNKIQHWGVLVVGFIFMISWITQMEIRSEMKSLRKDIGALVKEIENDHASKK